VQSSLLFLVLSLLLLLFLLLSLVVQVSQLLGKKLVLFEKLLDSGFQCCVAVLKWGLERWVVGVAGDRCCV
jgi:hypothetical protein